jgi:hypothetical protein
MIWRLLPFGLVAILVAGVLVSNFLACRLVNLSRGRLTGGDPKENCLKGSESFSMMDDPGTMSLRSLGDARNEKVAAPGDSKIVSVIR